MAVLGLTAWQGIAFALMGILFLAFLGGVAYLAQGRRPSRGRPDIPAAMQPGPSDADLEKPRLERLQGVGLGFVILLAVLVPLVWLKEPSENQNQEVAQLAESVERGRLAVQPFSEENQGGVGCVRCHGDQLQGGQNLYLGNIVTVPPLTNVCLGPNEAIHSGIKNLESVYNVIEQGRPGTDMPSWSVRYAGSLDDQQIQDIVNFIVSIQDPKEVPFGKNVCSNPQAKGYEPPVVAGE